MTRVQVRNLATTGWVFGAVIGCAAIAGACGQNTPTREWTPSDHDRVNPTRSPNQVQQTKIADPEADLAELAWNKDCSRCHGTLGQGDGPMAQMNHAPDLTRDDFLSSTNDDQIAQIIKGGRNQMPPFPQLPDRAIQGLIRRIRGKGRL